MTRSPSHGPGICRVDCLHRQMVDDYRAARQRDEVARDEVTIGYRTDEQLYRGHMVTFRKWLENLAGTGIYSRAA